MPPDELKLWIAYERNRDDDARNAICERYLALADETAKAFCVLGGGWRIWTK